MTKHTPAMQQYVDIKQQHPDCILFFRLGDFYEMFREDAKLCSKLLDLTLTSKNKNDQNPIPMAGVPHHSAEKYIDKLIGLGYKVAIAEQTSTPVPGKLVTREIKSIITPGTYINQGGKRHQYILAITQTPQTDNNHIHIARGDFAEGNYYTKSFTDMETCAKHIMIIQPLEIITDPDFSYRDALYDIKKQVRKITVSIADFPVDVDNFLQQTLHVSQLDGYGQALETGRRQTCALLLHYIHQTQAQTIHVNTITFQQGKNTVLLDQTTIKNLEIFTSSYDHNPEHSLFGVINTTNTPMGSRMLAQRLINPTQSGTILNQRFTYIQYFQEHSDTRNNIIKNIKQLNDIPKLISTIIYRKPRPTLIDKIRNNLQCIFVHDKHIIQDNIIYIGGNMQDIETLHTFYNTINTQLQRDITDNTINYIADGINETIDNLRKTAFHSDELLIEYQQLLTHMSGVSGIKIKYVTNQGYYIEITPTNVQQFENIINANQDKLSLTRRQTLKTAQRYTSPYLSSLETQIIEAKQQLIIEEKKILDTIISQMRSLHLTFAHLCDKLAQLDIYTSHALFAEHNNLTKPVIQKPKETHIIQGRHLIIEKFLPPHEHFIPNDLHIGTSLKKDGFLHIITGPNMGGKSTFLRQNALIVLLAHCGLYVPAKQANIQIVDALFARVGSGDALSRNQSTFMTEMIEVSNIIHNATHKSFIIFDELGRGTSTYDGLALTKAILYHVVQHTKSQTLIATHYHELIQLEKELPGIVNYSVSVYETNKEVVFLKKIIRGGANKSYGIEVAKLAGLPTTIITLATKFLQGLETKQNNQQQTTQQKVKQEQLFVGSPTTQIDETRLTIKSILQSHNIDDMTPLQALQLLAKIQSMIK